MRHDRARSRKATSCKVGEISQVRNVETFGCISLLLPESHLQNNAHEEYKFHTLYGLCSIDEILVIIVRVKKNDKLIRCKSGQKQSENIAIFTFVRANERSVKAASSAYSWTTSRLRQLVGELANDRGWVGRYTRAHERTRAAQRDGISRTNLNRERLGVVHRVVLKRRNARTSNRQSVLSTEKYTGAQCVFGSARVFRCVFLLFFFSFYRKVERLKITEMRMMGDGYVGSSAD